MIRSIYMFGLSLLMLVLAACGSTRGTAPTATQSTPMPSTMPSAMPSAMPGMDHGSMSNNSTAPYDATFIDSMIMHHEGAITMAKQALTEAEHPEIKTMANAVISAQEKEIAQMKAWRSSWYPDLAPTTGMGMDMGTMEIPAGDTPFDQRFLQAMIPHHEGATAMARNAGQKAEHGEIKTMAQAIIAAQDEEIAQMQQWLKTWYGVIP